MLINKKRPLCLFSFLRYRTLLIFELLGNEFKVLCVATKTKNNCQYLVNISTIIVITINRLLKRHDH